ncbi:MAG TPA: hypothetical protein DHV16_11805 [Nitrospiraceae bacterium]|nr:MAG: hypothetical protein A2Z82_04880 [Nitrospirae bacterium GWA2_46_11]HAK87580.1 hypothetical protein [Nitrospiraceae bacterium]HCZ12896.1 hypothetical protein [Nitrospiraceae bacterium]
MEQKPQVRNRLTSKISSFSANKEDLRKLFQILQERSHAAGDLEVANFRQMDQSDEVYENNKKILKEGFNLKPTVVSTDGKELWGGSKDIFESPNFPDHIKSIYVNSEIPLKAGYNYYSANSFELFLDFSKPDLFNLSFLPSQATPNESNIAVQGYDATWTHGVFSEFNSFIKSHPSKMTWLHRHSVYDFLVWMVGLPFGFWIIYRLSPFLNQLFDTFSVFVKSASYVYIFLASLIGFRLLFHYERWIWPMIEYQSPKSTALKHRLTLGAIVLSLVGSIIYDIFKAIF